METVMTLRQLTGALLIIVSCPTLSAWAADSASDRGSASAPAMNWVVPTSVMPDWKASLLQLRTNLHQKHITCNWQGEQVVQFRFQDGWCWMIADLMDEIRQAAKGKEVPMWRLYNDASMAVNSWVNSVDTATEQRLIRNRLERLGGAMADFPQAVEPLQREFKDLCEAHATWQDPRWLDLYERVCVAEQRLKPLRSLANVAASAAVMRDLFGDEFGPSGDRALATVEALTRQWKEIAPSVSRGSVEGLRALDGLLGRCKQLRHEVAFGLRSVKEFLTSNTAQDLQGEWLDQWALLQEDIARREWFAFIAPVAYLSQSLILKSDRDPVDVVLRRTAALMNEIALLRGQAPTREIKAVADRLNRLQKAAKAVSPELVDARRAIYMDACRLRRMVAFSNPLLDFDRILFIARDCPVHYTRAHHQFYGGERTRDGALLVLQQPFSSKPASRDLMAGVVCQNGRLKGHALHGDFLSPELSYDGQSVMFSLSKTGHKTAATNMTAENSHHIFRMNLDGADLRQLTDGPYEDFDACTLPDGDIVFISTRRDVFTMGDNSAVSPVFTLFRMHPDGTGIACLSPHTDHEWDPVVDHNGAVLYTRWDIWDRGYTSGQGLWTIMPDGRDGRAVVGNYQQLLSSYHMRAPNGPQQIMNARPVPDSRLVMATAICYFDPSYGSIILIDRSQPDDDRHSMIYRLTPDQLFPAHESGRSIGPINYATPWPLSERFFLCVYDGHSLLEKGPRNNYGLYLVDAFGNRELLFRRPDISCLSPMPVKSRRKPPVIPTLCRLDLLRQADDPSAAGSPAAAGEHAGDVAAAAGTVCVIDVYNSLKEIPIRVKRIRVVRALPKTTERFEEPATGYGYNKGGRMVLGTAPVEADGSSCFEMPPEALNVPVYFQALDEDGLAVQTMRTLVTVKPGERLTCLGCHEPRSRAPAVRSGYPLALTHRPSELTPDVTGREPATFPRLVQPVLDKYCVSCHDQKPKAEPSLIAGHWQDRPTKFYDSYLNLEKYVQSFKSHNSEPPRTTPAKFGARVSKLYTLLKQDHYGVKLPPEDLYRIALWIDLNGRFLGAYHDIDKQAEKQVVMPLPDAAALHAAPH